MHLCRGEVKTTDLFAPIQLGPYNLPNRIVMAPMTRARAGSDRLPNALMADYYAQRASAGLIITEASQISEQGIGWAETPGIHTDEQVKGWQPVTEAVHAQGGRIFLQLWHTGRASHPDFQPGGAVPVSASAVLPSGEIHTHLGKKPFVTPRALELDEIPGVVQDFANAAKRAQSAGFDGVEIHGANGYLIDQFLRDGVNQRSDAYGGSLANRARFMLEVVEAVANAWSPEFVAIRLSPTGAYNDMHDSDPIATFTYAAEALNAFDLAYLHVMEALPGHFMATDTERVTTYMRKAFNGLFMVNGGYDAKLGSAAIANDEADLVSYGIPFLANPDLPERFRLNAPLNSPDQTTFYTPGAKGYTDYSTLQLA